MQRTQMTQRTQRLLLSLRFDHCVNCVCYVLSRVRCERCVRCVNGWRPGQALVTSGVYGCRHALMYEASGRWSLVRDRSWLTEMRRNICDPSLPTSCRRREIKRHRRAKASSPSNINVSPHPSSLNDAVNRCQPAHILRLIAVFNDSSQTTRLFASTSSPQIHSGP